MSQLAIQVVDLGFGDSGKGAWVDYFAATTGARLVVRFNGGPQAAHNVVLDDGRHHCFSQFGSAALLPGVRTLLSRFMLIEPYSMLNEAAHLAGLIGGDPMFRTSVDERCLVVMPPQQIANRLRERARGASAHGTCGMGVGQCMKDANADPHAALAAGKLNDRPTVRRKLLACLEARRAELEPWITLANEQERRVLEDATWIDVAIDIYAEVARRAEIVSAARADQILRESPVTILEGAQGALLDERFGFHPHTTWSRTTFTNSDALLDESGSDATRQRVGVMRPYLTRHGAGPLVTERRSLDCIPEPHNRDDGWAGRFRRGILDLVMLRYAIEICGGVGALAVTSLDHLPLLPPLACDRYDLSGKAFVPTAGGCLEEMQQVTDALNRVTPHFRGWPVHSAQGFIREIEQELGTPVRYESRGANRKLKRAR